MNWMDATREENRVKWRRRLVQAGGLHGADAFEQFVQRAVGVRLALQFVGGQVHLRPPGQQQQSDLDRRQQRHPHRDLWLHQEERGEIAADQHPVEGRRKHGGGQHLPDRRAGPHP
jgi:hypothetical protein